MLPFLLPLSLLLLHQGVDLSGQRAASRGLTDEWTAGILGLLACAQFSFLNRKLLPDRAGMEVPALQANRLKR
jgi:hypothetical protein